MKRRDGAATETLHGWTPHDAVLEWSERESDAATAKNVLAIEAGATELTFFVNGEQVHAMAREGLHVDGVVGLRVNHGLDLHVSSLDVTESR